MTSRGIRSNNPGNIRKSATTTWRGQSASQPDKDFVTFDGPEWGIRAMVKVLLNYDALSVDTVKKIIQRWAPPVENNTKAYIASVAKRLGVEPDQELRLRDAAVMLPLLKAIITHENGSQPYADCTFVKAMQLAGLAVPKAAA